MVVIFHCYWSVPFMRPSIDGLGWLWSGVDIFFVISGYVMVSSTTGRDVSPLQFFRRRLERIVPVYWLATIIMIGAISGEWLFKIASFFFIPVTHPMSGLIEPIVQPGWTLNYEMFFYALFALTLLLRENARIWVMGAILGGSVLAGTLGQAEGVAGFYSRSIILEFLLGMAIAKYRLTTHWILIPIGFVALPLLCPIAGPRVLMQGLPAAAIVSGMLSLEGRLPRWKWLHLVGDASYSIYLFHVIVLAVAAEFWLGAGHVQSWFLPFALMAVIFCGITIHLALERPIIRYFQHLHRKQSQQLANATHMAHG